MTVHTYNPSVQVLLTKVISRKNGVASWYSEMPAQIDLTSYLGDAGVVRTVKNLGAPAGAFSISFADQPDHALGDTLYAFIEPMDMIEIRASREPEKYAGKKLPLIMRGFVSTVTRDESIGLDGTPQRLVIVEGQDAGKLWLINRIYFEAALVTDLPYLSEFKLQVALGIKVGVTHASDFITTVTNVVMNKKVAAMSAASNTTIKPFIVDSTVTQGSLTPQQIENVDQVPVWSLIDQFADRPWNELFIQDQEDGPHVVYRPTPFKDITGNLIDPLAADPGTIAVDIVDVVALRVARSDARVANFFWVPPGPALGDIGGGLAVAALRSGEPFDFNYANNNPALYGFRQMLASSNLFPQGLTAPAMMLPPADRQAAMSVVPAWFQARATLLKLMNRDNAVFEEGSAVLKGRETIVPGIYLNLLRGSLVSQSYIEQVAHTITPLRTWTTSVSFVRGTGFLARSNVPGGTPYLAEGRSGPYSPRGAASLPSSLQPALPGVVGA